MANVGVLSSQFAATLQPHIRSSLKNTAQHSSGHLYKGITGTCEERLPGREMSLVVAGAIQGVLRNTYTADPGLPQAPFRVFSETHTHGGSWSAAGAIQGVLRDTHTEDPGLPQAPFRVFSETHTRRILVCRRRHSGCSQRHTHGGSWSTAGAIQSVLRDTHTEDPGLPQAPFRVFSETHTHTEDPGLPQAPFRVFSETHTRRTLVCHGLEQGKSKFIELQKHGKPRGLSPST
ncbi:hypothetical protein RRG08_053971 [Elysia crispata]|uniref:Uncharacterized protein n=1 Tax=Elysia crispata TaxID=231223 RepID=A0AAE0ZE90_9GAST|nr:hypothetical protein RRG08_053971 [Elysia crispata]